MRRRVTLLYGARCFFPMMPNRTQTNTRPQRRTRCSTKQPRTANCEPNTRDRQRSETDTMQPEAVVKQARAQGWCGLSRLLGRHKVRKVGVTLQLLASTTMIRARVFLRPVFSSLRFLKVLGCRPSHHGVRSTTLRGRRNPSVVRTCAVQATCASFSTHFRCCTVRVPLGVLKIRQRARHWFERHRLTDHNEQTARGMTTEHSLTS